ncbi:biopolymer transporter ExbB [Algimonas ampicilliniresistens]|uniref:Biopolymer transporter ExbB n=1 Tax=Algimonas ampicilliniresistens TaxID=1298735 RepID=A0ABQ5VBL1_9PROT|nr:MotA/TolQ/ExbB proton channel family protein [Algimonas ampicilliniresistens]GLQ24889.1 biopolymer transporter ExbB [Algimonas ampicilliniresistens]
MKFYKSAMAALMGSALLVAAPASAQITSIQELLNQVRADAAEQDRINTQRVREFESNAAQQTEELRRARSELAQLEAQARRVESTFSANQNQIDGLKGELTAAQGEFGEVFGLARSMAGEFKSTLDRSLITAQLPNRTEVLGRVAESDALPSTSDLNAIWRTMLEEIVEQRKVASFSAQVAGIDGQTGVTRVGPFVAFTEDGGEFLQYNPPSSGGEDLPRLSLLPAQPGGAIQSAADRVLNASAGEVVYAPIDPTRGELLKTFDLRPGPWERAQQGGIIGNIIMLLGAVTGLLGLLLIVRLFLIRMAVAGQKRKSQPSKSNALGRVMLAYEGARNADADTVELKLDEAILQESPKLEFGLNFIKLIAGIAPLLGLLGTVTGMIQTFQAMMIYGAGDPQLMAGGISVALVTTMLGLIVAIPLLIIHSFAASLARSVQSTLEEQSAGIVARHVESRSAGSVGVAPVTKI